MCQLRPFAGGSVDDRIVLLSLRFHDERIEAAIFV
jgi:hypothetical protein